MAVRQGDAQAMSFSYNAVWDDTVRMLKGNASLLLPIAGAFLFLPAALAAYVVPPPVQAETLAPMIQHYRDNFWPLFLVQLIGFVGNLAILALLLDHRRPTVGGAITASFAMLLPYLAVSIISGLMIFGGLLLLIVPGLYLIGRLTVTGSVLVAEGRRNPFDIIRRSFALTKGNGWAVLGIVLLVFVAFYILSLAFTFVVGSVLLLIDRASGGGTGSFLLLVIGAALGAAFNTVLMTLSAAIYRRLAGEPQASTSGI
jgi:hypothetical protein